MGAPLRVVRPIEPYEAREGAKAQENVPLAALCIYPPFLCFVSFARACCLSQGRIEVSTGRRVGVKNILENVEAVFYIYTPVCEI